MLNISGLCNKGSLRIMAKATFTIAALGGDNWKISFENLGRVMTIRATPAEVADLSDALMKTKPAERYKKAFELTR